MAKTTRIEDGRRKTVIDMGNGNIKGKSETDETLFPHALLRMTSHEVATLEAQKELDVTPDVFEVNGVWYKVGERAFKRGANPALYGQARYTKEYAGVLSAIVLWKTQPNCKDMLVYASHTPKDLNYRPELIQSIKGRWQVRSQGVVRTYNVTNVLGFDEPIGAYRNATFNVARDGGITYEGVDSALLTGETLVIDIGAYTVAVSVAENGQIDYNASMSAVGGMLDVLEDFGGMIRERYKKELRTVNVLPHLKLRAALVDGCYDAAGHGTLDCKEEAKQAKQRVLSTVNRFYEQYGGQGTFNAVLLAGGGALVMGKDITTMIDHPRMFYAERDVREIVFSTVRGGYKTLMLLEQKGKL